eukprot:TRINITY_DN3965_c0_g1_i1.p1 TRINITY_DN3965_c0_g1~~TRINITY_DN3965_c0_g1_i1.p1  ORF type:complete len:184 (-),score=70.78 TRINITY_DN3965_c0_g1_i1:38-556(-)
MEELSLPTGSFDSAFDGNTDELHNSQLKDLEAKIEFLKNQNNTLRNEVEESRKEMREKEAKLMAEMEITDKNCKRAQNAYATLKTKANEQFNKLRTEKLQLQEQLNLKNDLIAKLTAEMEAKQHQEQQAASQAPQLAYYHNKIQILEIQNRALQQNYQNLLAAYQQLSSPLL